MIKSLTVLLLAFLAETAAGQDVHLKRLDSLLAVLSAKNLAMGSIAISKNGKVVYRRSIGAARVGGGDPLPADEYTEYRIGSISKLFTATLVFQLLEEKRLDFDDKVAAWFPEMPNAKTITVGNLLDHRSGLADFTKGTDFDSWKERPKSQEELLQLVASRPPDFAPNAKADYNNSNYLLLTFIIEKVMRAPYYALLNQRVIGRLGLNHTYYAQNLALKRYEAASCTFFDSKWIQGKEIWLDNFRGAGGIVSTPADLAIFIDALFTGKLVTPASLRKMETLVDGYGMGMFPFDFGNHPGFGHNGKTEGFASSLTYYPDDKIAIAYCTNGEILPKEEILDGVKSIIFDKPYTVPDFSPVAVDGVILDRDTGRYRSAADGIEAVVSRDGNSLVLETKGKRFPLVALSNTRFWNPPFGFFFGFGEGKLTITDVELEYVLSKQ